MHQGKKGVATKRVLQLK